MYYLWSYNRLEPVDDQDYYNLVSGVVGKVRSIFGLSIFIPDLEQEEKRPDTFLAPA